jgi:serine/threonine-protein kinase
LIANGGMGTVWCAADVALGRSVAIKLLAEAFIGDPSAARRFMREARAAARLSGHPNVVTIYDVGTCADRPYIVMEHLAGGTVADALRLGAFARPEALRWLDEAGAALDYAHGRGVVHRDVKPANMLLGTDRVLRLGDFGIASIGTDQTLSGSGELFGTAAYISPEQALGQQATAASDRYSLAVAAFELLTGTRPFDGDHFTAQARAHVEDRPPRASDRAEGLSRAVDSVLVRGMAKAPEDRWPTAQSFALALRGAVQGERTRHGPVLSLPAFGPRPRRAGGARRPAPSPLRPVEAPVEDPPLVIFDSIASAGVGRYRPALGAVAALALVAAIAGGAVGADGGGSPSTHSSALNAGTVRLKPATARRTAARTRTTRKRRPAPPRVKSTTTAPPRSATLAATLEARGHTLMTDGQYSAALPVLRQAVATAPPTTLTYAYALYDLGRTLQLAGDPTAAIPILEARLKIPNQPAVVYQELVVAKAAAAAQKSGQGTTPTGSTATTTTPTTTTPTTATQTTPTTPTAPTTTTPTAPGPKHPRPRPPAPTGGAGLD